MPGRHVGCLDNQNITHHRKDVTPHEQQSGRPEVQSNLSKSRSINCASAHSPAESRRSYPPAVRASRPCTPTNPPLLHRRLPPFMSRTLNRTCGVWQLRRRKPYTLPSRTLAHVDAVSMIRSPTATQSALLAWTTRTPGRTEEP